MEKKTELEKLKGQQAKSAWKRYMKIIYPNFKPRQWARSSYRNQHPQIDISSKS